MSTFTVPVTLIHPDDRDRTVTLDLLVDTGAFYMMLPPEIVAALGVATPELRTVEFASGDRAVIGMGEVRARLGDVEGPTRVLAGPPGCRTVLGAFTLEAFELAADPVHRRLLPILVFPA